jgi:hypothetical protein
MRQSIIEGDVVLEVVLDVVFTVHPVVILNVVSNPTTPLENLMEFSGVFFSPRS